MWIGFSSGSPIGSISCGDGYIYDDNHVENNEDFTITLEGYYYYRTVATPYNNTVHVTIIDNDGKSLFGFKFIPCLENECFSVRTA